MSTNLEDQLLAASEVTDERDAWATEVMRLADLADLQLARQAARRGRHRKPGLIVRLLKYASPTGARPDASEGALTPAAATPAPPLAYQHMAWPS